MQRCAQYYQAAKLDALGLPFINQTGCTLGMAEYRRDPKHNYDAEQAWLRRITSDNTRNAITCQKLSPFRPASPVLPTA